MDFRLLGIVECRRGEEPVQVAGTSVRAVLAMLLLRAGRVVLTDELAEGLWGERLPHDPTAAVRVTVSRLRHALGEDRERLRSVAGGFVLEVAPDQSDLGRAQSRLVEGRSLMAAGQAQPAEQLFQSALAEWAHDVPLAEFADLPFYAVAAGRLHRLRGEIISVANEASLACGHPHAVIDRAEVLLDLDPWDEQGVAQVMLALQQAGRPGEALAAYATLASRLRADFGTEPSDALEEIRAGIASRDPTLTAPTHAAAVNSLPQWFQSALSAAEEDDADPKLRARLRLALGEAQHLAGLSGWKETLAAAGDLAVTAGDVHTVARCALAGDLGWTATPGHSDRHRLELLDYCMDREGLLSDALLARLYAIYATELSLSSGLTRRISLSDRALSLARSSGLADVVLAVLNQRFSAIWAPETLEVRRQDTLEAGQLADASTNVLSQAVACGFAMAAAVETGDIDLTDHWLGRFTRLAQDLEAPVFAWGVPLHSSWRAVISGNLEQAEASADRARHLGLRACRPEADIIWTSQRAAISWARGELGSQLDALEKLPDLPALDATRTLARYHAGDVSGATTRIQTAWTRGDIAGLRHDQLYLTALIHWAELAALLGATEIATELFGLLAPFEDQVAFNGSCVYGPVAHALGLLSGILCSTAIAVEHFDRATHLSLRMRSPLFEQRSRQAVRTMLKME